MTINTKKCYDAKTNKIVSTKSNGIPNINNNYQNINANR